MTSIRRPGENLVRRITGSVMEVDVFETFVVKRPHGQRRPRDPEAPTAEDLPAVVERVQAAAADGVPGILACEFDPEEGTLVEELAPGVSLDRLDPPLTLEEMVHVYRETVRFAEAMRKHGVYLNRANPENTWLCRESGRVIQTDFHHQRPDDPEMHSDEGLRARVVTMIARGYVDAGFLAGGAPGQKEMAQEALEAITPAREAFRRLRDAEAAGHGAATIACLRQNMDRAYRIADPPLRCLERETKRRDAIAKRYEPSVRAVLDQAERGEPLEWVEPER